MMNTPRLMLAAASSGCGKTTVACAILQALSSAARPPTLRQNLPDLSGQQTLYVTVRTGDAAQVVCLTQQGAFVQAKTKNAVVYRIADGAGLYETVRTACL